MSGRTLPTVIKINRGTMKSTRVNPHEPKSPLGAPPRPSYLSKEEREVWDSYAAILLGMRVLTKNDGAALEQLACSTAEANRLRAVIRKKGNTYETTTPQGSTMVRPRFEVGMLRAVNCEVAMLLARFGLTPGDRPNVSAAPDPESNPDDIF